MPSPIAHLGLAVLAPRVLPVERLRRLPRWRLTSFYGLCLFALVAPDFDFLISWAIAGDPRPFHGLFLHSFVAALLFAPIFGAVAARLGRLGFTRMTLLGFAAYAGHVLLDAMTHGRGIAMLWPFIDHRLALPPLFVGFSHSEPLNWRSHLITLLNEAAFIGVVWLLARRTRRHRPTGAPAGQSLVPGADA